MYTAWNLDSVRQCIQQTKLTTLVTAHRNLPAILSICHECPTLRWIILSDRAPSEENNDRAQRLGIILETFTAVENIGAANPCEELPKPSKL
jgi:hypothetical protein